MNETTLKITQYIEEGKAIIKQLFKVFINAAGNFPLSWPLKLI
jgi:hypothetical protein